MPQVIPFIAQAIAEFLFFELGITAVVATISTALTVGLFAASIIVPLLLAPGAAGPFRSSAAARTQMIREPVTSRKYHYGEIKLSGALILVESTENNKFHHFIVPIADRLIQKFGTVYFNDDPIFEDHIDMNGEVTQGIYAGKARIKKHLGDDNQLADPDLVAEVEKWTTEHRGRGVAYLYIRIDFDRDTYPTGIPNISVVTQGAKVFDPRNLSTLYSNNSALCVRDYLTDQKYGIEAENSEIDTTFFNSDANTCDEFVLTALHAHEITSVDTVNDEFTLDGTSLKYSHENKIRLTTTGTLPTNFALDTDYFIIVSSIAGRVVRLASDRQNARDGIPIDVVDSGSGTHTLSRGTFHTVLSVDTALDALLLDEERLLFQTGDKVQLQTTGTAPGGLAIATDYYVIVFHEQNIVDDDDVIQFDCGIKLATTYANALEGIDIDITTAGTGTHLMVKRAEPRYTCDGQIDSSVDLFSNLGRLLTSMAGTISKVGASWKSYAGVFRSAVPSFNEEHVIGQIKTPSKVTRGARFNLVKGTYVSPKNDWEPQDYPAVTKTEFQTEDGKVIENDIDFSFTTRTQMAQRLAQIALRRSRNEVTTELILKLKTLEAQVGSNIKFSNIIRGWTDKLFEVATLEFAVLSDKKGRQFFGMNFGIKETFATDFDFDPDVDEIISDSNPASDLPSAFFVTAPEGLTAVEEIFEGRQGAGVKSRVKVSWNPSTDAFARWFQVEHKLQSDPTFFVEPSTQDTIINLDDLKPGDYDIRVKAISDLGSSSVYTNTTVTVSGLLAPPEEPQGMTITIVGGTAYIRWTLSADLDVRVGGQILFRHSKKLTGATWQESVSIGENLGGSETLAVLPLKEGNYLAKFKDSEGGLSIATAAVTTKQAQIQDYTTSGTINEHPNFAGGLGRTVIDEADNLRLRGNDLMDDWPDVDALADFDIGSDGIYDTSNDPIFGSYVFAAAFDLGSVVKRRITTIISSINVNIFNLIDDRVDLFDDWTDFDQAGVDAPADAQIFMRQTDDDPTGTPTWGPFERIEAVEVEAWGLEFACVLTTTSKDTNILVDELTVKQESLT